MPESVATLFCTREEKRKDGITWPAGAGREVEEILSAMEHAFEFWNNVERAVVGTGGRVCTIDWGSEHGRKRRTCPKRARVKEKGTTGHQRGLRPAPGTCYILLAADVFLFGLFHVDLRINYEAPP